MPLILIVDDRQTNRTIFTQLMMFLDKDISVETMAIPEMALNWLESKTPDLIIVDYSMPDMNGAEFTRHVRNMPRLVGVPVIIITAYGESTFEINALQAGATDFLRSPVDHYDFIRRARGLMSGASNEAATDFRVRNDSKKTKPAASESLRILISEKNDFNRKSMERVLTQAGHRCLTVLDSDEALDALEAKEFDLVLMSTSPAYVEALEATKLYRFIALDQHHVPIVALIDVNVPELGPRCIEAGMDAYLLRPATLDSLLEITQRYALRKAG
jgi:CheY-like chemotaxis protein